MIEYEKINLNPQTEKKPCGCKETKKDCSCNNKINIKNDCATPQCFKVDNYFSELVHNWEKEAARYNLGIQELEGIEYVTENKDDELLTKVIFKYRQGHELITREFYCAPAGPEGKPGKDGRDGDIGPQGPKGDKGDTPTLNKVILTWVNNCDDEGGRFIEDCLNNGYNLELKLKRPDVFEELSKILDLINEQLTQFYAKKSDLIDYVKNATFTNTITDILNRLSTAGAEYRLVYNAPWLYLTKDGKNVSSVKVEGGTSSGNSYYFTGSVFVYQIFPINYSEIPDIKKIVGSNWENTGWQKSLPDRENENNEAVWMATCNVESGSYGTWSYTKLTGANGIDGVDSDNLEFVYYRTVNSYIPSNKMPHITDPSADKPVPSDSDWLDHPLGVTEDVPYEFYSFSKKENDRWSEFVLPMIWSHYGRNGHDGDGVEYIFKTVNLVNTLINPTPIDITYALYQKPEYVPSDWSDNPNSSLTSGQYLYVCQRTYRKVTQAHVNKYSEYGLTSEHIDSYMWLPFSDPAIWNYYAKDGEGSQGLAGAVIRTRGEWKPGQPYYRNCAEAEGGIKYIDIVLYDGEYYIVSLEQDGKSFISCDTWECDKEHWTKATGFDFIATRALKADNAEINYLDTNEVRIWDSKTKTAEHLVAGMTSGQNLDDTDPIKGNKTEVRIWAGKTEVGDNVDLNIAPFRVYSDGSLVANNATVTGTFNQNNIWVNQNVLLGNYKMGFMGWLIVSDESEHTIQCSSNNTYILYDDDLLNKIIVSENGLYFIVKINSTLFKVYKFNQANRKIYCDYDVRGWITADQKTTVDLGYNVNEGLNYENSLPDELIFVIENVNASAFPALDKSSVPEGLEDVSFDNVFGVNFSECCLDFSDHNKYRLLARKPSNGEITNDVVDPSFSPSIINTLLSGFTLNPEAICKYNSGFITITIKINLNNSLSEGLLIFENSSGNEYFSVEEDGAYAGWNTDDDLYVYVYEYNQSANEWRRSYPIITLSNEGPGNKSVIFRFTDLINNLFETLNSTILCKFMTGYTYTKCNNPQLVQLSLDGNVYDQSGKVLVVSDGTNILNLTNTPLTIKYLDGSYLTICSKAENPSGIAIAKQNSELVALDIYNEQQAQSVNP